MRDVAHDLDQGERDMDHDDGVMEGVEEDGKTLEHGWSPMMMLPSELRT